MSCFFGVSLIGVTADGAGRCGVIMVLLMNFTVGYALKYAAKPPVFHFFLFWVQVKKETISKWANFSIAQNKKEENSRRHQTQSGRYVDFCWKNTHLNNRSVLFVAFVKTYQQ